jgi:hypothetical protein
MFKSPRLALASVAAVVALAGVPAQAALTTFANFTGLDANAGVRFQNGAANNVSGTTGSLYSIDSSSPSNAPGSRLVSFSFLQPALAATVTNVTSSFTLFASTVSPAQTFGQFTGQSNLVGGFSFRSTNAITVGSTVYAAGSNLLTGTFNDVSIIGQTNASSAAYGGSTTSGSTISFTSDFLNFAPMSDYDFSISLTSLTPLLFAQPGSALRSFEAYSTGSFSAEPAPAISAIPEPSVWGLMIVGFGLVGFQSRRRRTATLSVAA